jgi:DNA invertase Pin-like site-specific DNA recombinase
MSTAMLTMMSAFAELEHSLIVDRLRDGRRRAKKAGVVFGRPRADGPSPDDVRRQRKANRSWTEIAKLYGCTVGLARRRAEESL